MLQAASDPTSSRVVMMRQAFTAATPTSHDRVAEGLHRAVGLSAAIEDLLWHLSETRAGAALPEGLSVVSEVLHETLIATRDEFETLRRSIRSAEDNEDADNTAD